MTDNRPKRVRLSALEAATRHQASVEVPHAA